MNNDNNTELIYRMPSAECTVPLKWHATSKGLDLIENMNMIKITIFLHFFMYIWWFFNFCFCFVWKAYQTLSLHQNCPSA